MRKMDPFGWSPVPGHPYWEETQVLGQRYSCPTGPGCILGALVFGGGTTFMLSQVSTFYVGLAWGIVVAMVPFMVRSKVHDAWGKAYVLAERLKAKEEGFGPR